ncbi:hypothetical protein ACIQTZ_05490 [Paenarthrobacter sp. NPDC090520]|uniref:hypothetical protein n=1 Tax=Paenarthrobacter sp. NPDC090520 TaxID=3364382 RepID=UPI0037FCA54C
MDLFEGPLWVHYGQATVESAGAQPRDYGDAFRQQHNGICGAASSGVLELVTGLHTGDVGFTVELFESEPDYEDSWEEIVEVSFLAEGAVRLIEWGDAASYQLELLPGPYRVRYCAAGMDAGREADTTMDTDGILDTYKLIFWPSTAPSADVVVKQTSGSARQGHEWARSLH